MPFPNISGSGNTYRQYLRYSDYDRLRYSKRFRNYLTRNSTRLTGTGMTQVSFNADLSNNRFSTSSAHGFSVGDGPLQIGLVIGGTIASLVLVVAVLPAVGDTITVNGLTTTTVYRFIAAGGTPGANEIAIGANLAGTATNLSAKLTSHPDINSRVGSDTVSITVAAVADGAAGNGNSIASSNDTAITGEGSLSGGSDPNPAPPLSENVNYYIRTVPSTMSFTLSIDQGGAIIRPTANSLGQYALVQGTTESAIYELLKRYPARIINIEDDIDDLI